MGCCCSSCCCNPDVEPSRTPEELSRSNTDQSKSGRTPSAPRAPLVPLVPLIPPLPRGQAGVLPPSKPSQSSPASPPSQPSQSSHAQRTQAVASPRQPDHDSIPDEQPPPYEQNDRSSVLGSHDTLEQPIVAASSSSQAVRDLPYVIPLTTNGPDMTAEDSLAAAYAPDLQELGIPSSRYMSFLAGLDRGLFASPSAEPGSVSAHIQSMFRDQGSSDLTWSSSPTSLSDSQQYVSQANNDLFHKAAVHVEVLKTHEMKERIDAASHAELLRAQGVAKLDKIEDKRSQEALKLEQKLLTSKTLDKQQKAMRKYLEKDERYNQKALKAINKYEGRIDRAESSRRPQEDDGVYWLLVSKYQS